MNPIKVRIPYAERKPATGRAVSARLTARKTHQPRKNLRSAQRRTTRVLLALRQAECGTVLLPALPGGTSRTPSPTFRIPKVRIPYAERKPATGRAVSARLTARKTHQSRKNLRSAQRRTTRVLLALRQAECGTVWLQALPGYLVPKMRSPASPRPGTMYLCSFRRSSQAAM